MKNFSITCHQIVFKYKGNNFMELLVFMTSSFIILMIIVSLGFKKLTMYMDQAPNYSEDSEAHDRFPLTIELVPDSCWCSNLQSILSTDQWNQLRHKTYRIAKGCCRICRKTPGRLYCHEIWHYDDVSKTQILKGLIALCQACHQVRLIGAKAPRNYKKVAEHFKVVNKMTNQEARKYIDDCFDICGFRSSFYWDCDLSWLETQGLSIPNISENLSANEYNHYAPILC